MSVPRVQRWVNVLLAAAGALAAAQAWAADAGSAGCGAAAPDNGTYTLTHAGVARSYALSLPAGYDAHRPARLVLAFHGWSGDEREFLGDETVIREASRRGYIVAAPRGLGSGAPDHSNNSWTFPGSATGAVGAGSAPAPICDASITPDYTYPSCRGGRALNSCSWTQCQDDDVSFVSDLIDHLEATLCIDRRHVYATGGSNGGMFTWELGMNPKTAPRLRAIAPIIGLPHRGDLRAPGRPGGMAALLVTGTADIVVPPGKWDDPEFTTTSNDRDRFYYTGATAIIRTWSRAAACPIDGKERPFKTGYAAAECRSYCAAQDGAWPLVLDCRAPMGHDYQLGWSWKLVMDFFDRL